MAFCCLILKQGRELLCRHLPRFFLSVWRCKEMPSNFKEPTISTMLKRKGARTDSSSHQSGHLCALHFWTEAFWIIDHALLESWCGFRLQCDVADLILCGTSDIGNMQVTKLRSPSFHLVTLNLLKQKEPLSSYFSSCEISWSFKNIY